MDEQEKEKNGKVGGKPGEAELPQEVGSQEDYRREPRRCFVKKPFCKPKEQNGGQDEKKLVDEADEDFGLEMAEVVGIINGRRFEIEGKRFHGDGQQSRPERCVGKIGMISLKEHGVFSFIRPVFSNKFEAQRADKVGGKALAVGQIAGDLGGVHGFDGGKAVGFAQIVHEQHGDKEQNSCEDGKISPTFAHFDFVNEVLKNLHFSLGVDFPSDNFSEQGAAADAQ